MHASTRPIWLADGRLVFGLSDPPPSQGELNLWSLRVDPRSGAPSGTPRRITQWQGVQFVAPTGVSADGKHLTVVVASYQSDCYTGRIAGGDSLLQNVTRLTLDDRFDVGPCWLPDGKSILFASNRNGTADVFKQAIGAPEAEPLVMGPGNQGGPLVTPDGARILYVDTPGAALGSDPPHGAVQGTRLPRLRVISLPGGAVHEVRLDRPMNILNITWTADGRGWLVIDQHRGVEWNLRKIDLDGKSTPQLPAQMWMYSAAVSPDGQHVAFTSNTGSESVWLLDNF